MYLIVPIPAEVEAESIVKTQISSATAVANGFLGAAGYKLRDWLAVRIKTRTAELDWGGCKYVKQYRDNKEPSKCVNTVEWHTVYLYLLVIFYIHKWPELEKRNWNRIIKLLPSLPQAASSMDFFRRFVPRQHRVAGLAHPN